MTEPYPQSPEDSARFLAERQPVANMAQMGQIIEWQAETIRRLTCENKQLSNRNKDAADIALCHNIDHRHARKDIFNKLTGQNIAQAEFDNRKPGELN